MATTTTNTIMDDDLPDIYKDLPVVMDDDASNVDGTVGGVPIVMWVVFGFLVASIPIAALIFWLSRTQERHKRRQRMSMASSSRSREAEKGKQGLQPYVAVLLVRYKHLTHFRPYLLVTVSEEEASKQLYFESARKSLTCTPYNDTMSNLCCESSTTSASSNDEDEPQQTQDKTSCACAICNKDYQVGQPVYESNNPECGHVFHKNCMDSWLEIQNNCPTCNRPFALLPQKETV